MHPRAHAQETYASCFATVLGTRSELSRCTASVAHVVPDERGLQHRRMQRFVTFLASCKLAPYCQAPSVAISRRVEDNPEYPESIKLSAGSARWNLRDLGRYENQKKRHATKRFETKPAGVSP